MTAFVLSLLRAESRQPFISVEDSMTMKALLIGMLACMAAGADTMLFIPDGPLNIQQRFVFGLICGTIGTIVGCAICDIQNAKQLARHAIANLGLAVLGGATLASVIAYCFKLEPTLLVVAPSSGICGISGSAILDKLWPMILERLARRASKAADSVLGLEEKDEGK